MLPGARPLRELDLGDEPGLDEDAPRAAAVRRRVNGECLAPERREQPLQPLQLLLAEAGARRARRSAARRPARSTPSSSAPIVALRLPLPGSQPPITNSWRPNVLIFSQPPPRRPGS